MLKRMFAAALLVCGLAFCSSAKADSYTFSIVGNANQNYFVAGNDFGDYITHVGQVSMYCGNAANTCFGTHIAATNTTTYTTYQPTLASDPNPVAGSGCTYGGPASYSICTNGHEVVYGLYGDHGLYTVNGQTLTPAGYGGGFEFVIQSANGNLFFSDTVNENLIVGINSTVTPEPSSLALLGTGVLGLIGAARRRFAA